MEKNLDELYTLLKTFDTAMMTTVAGDGRLLSRPMATQDPPLPESDLWFVTAVDTEKARDLEADSRVNLAYYHEKDRSWVSVAGLARLELNRDRIRELWKEDWRVWFPEGPEDSELAIIHVMTESVIYWKPDGGRIRTLFEIARAYVKREEPDLEPPVVLDP